MAKMIPRWLDVLYVQSSAEKRLFCLFRDAPGTNDWTIIHSLNLANHPTQIMGEIDFVVLAPDLGIFCLEVKGGVVEVHQGLWTFQNRRGEKTIKSRGPFEQARNGMFALKSYLESKVQDTVQLKNVLFDYCCVFPDITMDYISIDHQPWQTIDSIDFSLSPKLWITNLAKDSKEHWNKHYPDMPRSGPSKQLIDEIVSRLIPDCKFISSLANVITQTQIQIDSLTKSQMNVMISAEGNERLLIQGAAGTGKTVLAVEICQRIARNEDLKIGFFCFNSKLGQWLKITTSKNIKNVYAGSFYNFLFQSYKTFLPNNMKQLTNSADTEAFLKTISGIVSRESELFDCLIIDEAQDLFSGDFFMIFDKLLKGGISKGRWLFFGDFKFQNIYSHNTIGTTILNNYTNNYTRLTLPDNCRNTEQICTSIESLYDVKYHNFLQLPKGPSVNYHQFSNEDEFISKIIDVLNGFKKDNVKDTDIVILALTKYDIDLLKLHFQHKIIIDDYKIPSSLNKGITCSTVHSFKGLESSVILLIGITDYSPMTLPLIYIGMSRAKVSLIVFETSDAKSARNNIIANNSFRKDSNA